MVKAIPETKEVADFLESVSPVLPPETEEGGEEEGGEEEVPLSSSVLHRVEELELSRGERGEEEEEEEEEEGEGEKSVSSNGDYQESFQDLQVNVQKFYIGCIFAR